MDIRVKTIEHPTLKRWNVEIKERVNDCVEDAPRYYLIVCDTRSLWNDNPIKVSDGRILYDWPERVPAYAKNLVARGFAWIENASSHNGGAKVNQIEQPKEVWMIRKDEAFADCWILYGADWIVSASDNPAHPLGVWSATQIDRARMCTDLGVVVTWADVPATVQAAIVDWLAPEEAQGA